MGGEKVSVLIQGAIGIRKGMLEGDLEYGYISVSNGVTYIKQIRSVKSVIDDLMQNVKSSSHKDMDIFLCVDVNLGLIVIFLL